MTYCGISLRLNLSSWWQQLLEKAYGLWYLNEVKISDSLALMKAKNC